MRDILTVSSSPHIKTSENTRDIMADVLIALTPAAIFGCLLFGIKAAILLAVSVVTAIVAELLWDLLLKKPISIGDCSAAVTGLLLGMNLSVKTPVFVAVIGSAVAIIVVKQMFGGLGHNFVNPAIAARIVLLVSFPKAMSSFADPFTQNISAVTSATPLALEKGATSLKNLFFGLHAGCIGETSAFLLLIGFGYLLIRKVVSPIIPLSFIGTVAVLNLFFGGDVLAQILSGGLMLGAIFMATDYTTSPTDKWGKLIFGIGCGAITFIIRKFGALPEGVSYSIILMNILVPHINKLTASRPFGYRKAAK